MNRLVKTIKTQFEKMVEREWDTLYIFVDVHETIVPPTYSVQMSTEFYPKALKTLQLMSSHKNIKLILWSSSLPATNLDYQKMFKEKGVNFEAINGNPFEASTPYADFDSKPYMSLILDDKAGFLQSDWESLHDYMVMLEALQILDGVRRGQVGNGKIDTFLDDLEINLKYGY